jgi:hypothetical protein
MTPSKCPPCPFCDVELQPSVNQGVLVGWRCENPECQFRKAYPIER